MSDNIEGLIFDCDGTLVDSMPAHWLAWKEVTERHGLDFPEERFYALGGVPSWQIIKMLSDEQGVPVDVMALSHEKEEAYLPYMDQVRPLLPVVSIVSDWHGRVPMSVATGGIRSVIEPLLDHVGLSKYFDAIVTSEDVSNQKPAPDIFLEAARRIRTPPAKCRAYEDTDLGMQAIIAAGMDAVDVRKML
jgi:beta-phosphoglucomutase family hydrolase